MKLQAIALGSMLTMIGVVACSGAPEDRAEPAQEARATQRLGTTPDGEGLLCSHPICAVGAPLTLLCDVCTSLLCVKDPYCCNTAWDATCVGEVSSICGQSCTVQPDAGGGGSTCSHALCATGAALDATCDSCATSLCAQDPYCCSTGWDATCVGEVSSICGKTCP